MAGDNNIEEFKSTKLAVGNCVAEAQLGLGMMYVNGQGVGQDYVLAVKWIKLAAAQGLAGAQLSMGFMCANGQGVEQNEADAVRWYRLAAEQGDALAQFSLGLTYNYGKGVEQNHVEAARWYRLAAVQGYVKAQIHGCVDNIQLGNLSVSQISNCLIVFLYRCNCFLLLLPILLSLKQFTCSLLLLL